MPIFWRAGLLVLAMAVSTVAQAPAPASIWVVRAPGEIVEHDPATFDTRRTLSVPARVVEHPEYLRVNGRGQLLFSTPTGVEFGGGDLVGSSRRVWAWDGRQAREWAREDEPDTARQWFLSVAGDALFAFENRFAIVRDRDGIERSVRASARLWLTDLDGGNRRVALELPALPSCTCETGACSESCPEWSAWAPDGVVGEFLLITRLIPGQLQTRYQGSTLYRRAGQAWKPTALAQPIEEPLNAASGGQAILAAQLDAGCCGWMNESSDRLLLMRGASVSTVFDEFDRYANGDYDVSIRASRARLSPNGGRVAYTLVADAPEAGEIRLSSDGKANSQALARLRQALADLPAVEIALLGRLAASPVVIRHAELVGWLSDTDLLVVQGGRLAVYSDRGVRRRETPVTVTAAAGVFVR